MTKKNWYICYNKTIAYFIIRNTFWRDEGIQIFNQVSFFLHNAFLHALFLQQCLND